MREMDFLQAIESDACDPTPRLVYADWLDEQGNPRGELLRIQEELRHIEVSNRPAKEARMHELLNAGVEPLMITKSNSLGMSFVLIFPGEFLMGSPPNEEGREPNEGQVPVTLTQPFYLSQNVTTQAQWQRIMRTSPWRGHRWLEDFNHPATHIGWTDAMIFSDRLTQTVSRSLLSWSYTLPTEAQWEYACRAGTTTRFSFGDNADLLDQYGWFSSSNTLAFGNLSPHPVAQKRANPWGLFDMHGNVSEWCQDGYQQRLGGGTNPVIADASWGRIQRGGCWLGGDFLCRSAARGYFLEDESASGIMGFRLALIP